MASFNFSILLETPPNIKPRRRFLQSNGRVQAWVDYGKRTELA